MTGARAHRNRVNARKSTGPRSEHGKRRSSRNALQHGATARPELGEVTLWLRVILDDPCIDAEDILDGDARMTAALALAEAEASLAAAERALEDFERGTAAPSDVAKMFFKERDMLLDWMSEFEMEGMMEQSDRVYTAKLLLRQGRIIHDETSIGGKRHKLLQLYAKRARSRRQKAFEAWLETCTPLAGSRSEKTKPDHGHVRGSDQPDRIRKRVGAHIEEIVDIGAASANHHPGRDMERDGRGSGGRSCSKGNDRDEEGQGAGADGSDRSKDPVLYDPVLYDPVRGLSFKFDL